MTTIQIYKNAKQEYKGFVCIGHAEYSEGTDPDILCAAVSFLVINTINVLDELAGEELNISENEEGGFIKCEIPGKLNSNSSFLLDAMVYGLQSLSNTYGSGYLQIKCKEV